MENNVDIPLKNEFNYKLIDTFNNDTLEIYLVKDGVSFALKYKDHLFYANRMISKDRVLELSKLCINAIHDKKTMIFDRIILVEYDEYIFILDGQHRIFAIFNTQKLIPSFNMELLVYKYKVNNDQEAILLLQQINNILPYKHINDKYTELLDNIYKLYGATKKTDKYCIKKNEYRAMYPNWNLRELKDILEESQLLEQTNLSIQEIIEQIELFNKELQYNFKLIQTLNSNKLMEKYYNEILKYNCNRNKFFIGLISINIFIYKIKDKIL